MKRFIAILVTLWGASSAAARTCADLTLVSASSIKKTNDKPKASALIVHGLNSSSTVMTDIENMLLAQNVQTLNVALHGHRGNLDELKSTTKEHWLQDVFEGYCLLRSSQLPIVYVGYSLGGLLGPYMIAREKAAHFDGVVLFAPALSVHWHLRVLHFLGHLLPASFVIPARTPEAYRMHRGVPVSTYREFFSMLDEFQSLHEIQSDFPEKLRVPGLVVLDEGDELIDATGVRNFIKRHDLRNFWTLVDARSQNNYRHLVIDQTSLGARTWVSLQDQLRSLLSSTIRK